LLMFDVTRLSSFSNIKRWIEELRGHADPHIVAMLIGNKSDLARLRVVPAEVAEAFAGALQTLSPTFLLYLYESETAPLRTCADCLFFFVFSGKWNDLYGNVRV
jgi:GTPase SAR1 family protein